MILFFSVPFRAVRIYRWRDASFGDRTVAAIMVDTMTAVVTMMMITAVAMVAMAREEVQPAKRKQQTKEKRQWT